MANESKIILGIDPGTVVMGYGLISVTGNRLDLVTMGVIHLRKLQDHYRKLGLIYQRIESIIKEFKPDAVSYEAPFYGNNVQSMLKLGRAQGVAMAPAILHNIPVFEYAPRKIKQSITGNGNASKEQVAHMVYSLLKIEEKAQYFDATDGIAAAICHHFQSQKPMGGKEAKDWKEFIRKNPGRIS
ncbi:MAG: crossover junction endodeoxyribonuclease RuvC [Bacteroidetes bacterium]|jgi:crossover junction endodeoxyribonuclease RuvC|nr:crossover junction endodeoxyribonuclease RuvC [Bacteroidota bacterium]MBT3748240.1 crossover junction endodeoxyribonuclease RuvC [Bacteroidota bacterium]MBT4408467.1 crossover junction endodeoxyribonuclease RuvC [Bacteroidota bacterium]MBT7092963.1 crossover junction endodeoxyribonuclease RuvC [Bacteroidota bacterium]MBT7465398.1 crossover junction endodeoxyribonuclease RuvC [Bacteroidota bacterium]